MTYRNSLMTELMIPRTHEVAARLTGFYEEIGWSALSDSQEQFLTYVHPIMPSESPLAVPPTIAYWQTQDPGKRQAFVMHETEIPSRHAWGLRLPNMQQLVEVCLVVPSDETVHDIFDRGGPVLEAHTHIPPREHAGRQEFRFADPFNYSLRVTADPGWEIRPQLRITAEEEVQKPLTTRLHTLVEYQGELRTLDIITPQNLRNASERFFKTTHTGERLKRLFSTEHADLFCEFLYFEDRGGKALGIIKEQLGPLIIHMEQQRLFKEIRGLGERAEKLMRGLYDYLFPGQSLDAEED